MNDNIVTFVYESESLKCQKLELPVMVPYNGCIKELAAIFFKNNNVPVYLEEEFLKNLELFINQCTQEYHDKKSQQCIDRAKSGKIDIEDIIKKWEKKYKEECYEYSERKCVSDEELFAIAYHKLVHSPVLGTMLQLEHTYAQAVQERTKTRDRQRYHLEQKQTEEMNEAVDNLNITQDEKSINELVAKHFEDLSILQAEWSSELDTTKEVQRRDYREWIMQMLEENQANSSLPTPSSTSSPINPASMQFSNEPRSTSDTYKVENPTFEESFTIHLGSQLKQMHNIRILSTDVMDLCSPCDKMEPRAEPPPHMLQTALALYSNDLCGLVLMTDNHVDSYSKSLKGELNEQTEKY